MSKPIYDDMKLKDLGNILKNAGPKSSLFHIANTNTILFIIDDASDGLFLIEMDCEEITEEKYARLLARSSRRQWMGSEKMN